MWRSSPISTLSILAGFLEIQEDLLLRIMEAIQAAGTRMALPSQNTYVLPDSKFEETSLPEVLKIPVHH